MAVINHVSGVPEIIRNMQRKNVQLGAGVARGLKLAGLFLQRESQKLVPVEFGLLKASAFTRATGKSFKTVVNMGYTAAYALYVHEAVGMVLKGQPRTPNPPHKGSYWDPQGRAQAKFLQEPAMTKAATMRRIIRENSKI